MANIDCIHKIAQPYCPCLLTKQILSLHLLPVRRKKIASGGTMPLCAASIKAPTLKAIHELLQFGVDVQRTSVRKSNSHFEARAILQFDLVAQLRQRGYVLSDVIDLSAKFGKMRTLISRGRPLQVRGGIHDLRDPANEGYFLVDQIEEFIQQTSSQYPGFVSCIELPNKTAGDVQCSPRTSHLARICAGQQSGRVGVLITGGVHAREWVGADVCVNVLYYLTSWYHSNVDLVLGGKTFFHDWIDAIVDRLDIFVFPDVNPDGRAFSQGQNDDTASGWRKNRRLLADNNIGVDLNRNYDVLWRYSGYPFQVSDDPTSLVYKGPSPFSEQETKNVKWILDTYPNIEFFADVHTTASKTDILYPWGDCLDQSTNPMMNIQNELYDVDRATPGSGYGEYMPQEDVDLLTNLGNRMSAAVSQVRQSPFPTIQSAQYYPTVGTGDDYCYSRWFTDTNMTKIHPFTIECVGGPTYSPDDSTERVAVIEEVAAGLIELCCGVISSRGWAPQSLAKA